MSKTLFEKIWDKHVVDTLPDGTIQLYIDRLYCHVRISHKRHSLLPRLARKSLVRSRLREVLLYSVSS